MSGGSQPSRSVALACVSVLLGHSERVWSVSWHPAGELLASCSSDRTVRVWRRADEAEGGGGWQCCAVLDGVHSRTVRCVSWSPCGRLLASAGFDGRVAVWSMKQQQQQTSDGDKQRTVQHHNGQHDEKEEERVDVDVQGGGDSGGELGWATPLPPPSFECVCQLEGHENEVKCVSWSADGRLLASCSRDKTVWLWEKDEAADGSVGFECVSVCSGHSADVKHVSFHPQLPLLLSASYDNAIRVWREEEEDAGGEWEAAHTLEGHSSTVWMADWLRPDQRLQQSEQEAALQRVSVLSAGDDTTVRVWRPSQPVSSLSTAAIASVSYRCTQSIATPHTRSIFALHQHQHSGLLATCGADDSICLYEQQADSAQPNEQSHPPQPADGGSAVPSSFPRFHVALQHKRAHQGDVNCVRFHPFPSPVLLASCGDDGSIKLWQIESKQQQQQGVAETSTHIQKK